MSPDTASTETFQAPVINPVTGGRWEVEAEAESPRDAMQKASDGMELHITSSFIQKHLEVGNGR